MEEGAKSVAYTGLVEWLSKEISALAKLDEHVNTITSKGSFIILLDARPY